MNVDSGDEGSGNERDGNEKLEQAQTAKARDEHLFSSGNLRKVLNNLRIFSAKIKFLEVDDKFCWITDEIKQKSRS